MLRPEFTETLAYVDLDHSEILADIHSDHRAMTTSNLSLSMCSMVSRVIHFLEIVITFSAGIF